MIQRLGLAAAAAMLFATSAAAQSATTVLGGGMAQACSDAATAQVRAAERRRGAVVLSPPDAIRACDQALSVELLTMRDLAATHVNRGVLLMGRADYAAALADYEAALRVRATLAEAHANRGAALIALGRYAEGVEEITQGLALNTEEPEKSYYNRAMGRERLDDLKGAYLDYVKASQLKPDWPDPKMQLTRFTLTPK